MKDFMQGFPWAWGPRTPSGRPKFGIGTFCGMILVSIMILIMLTTSIFGDGTLPPTQNQFKEEAASFEVRKVELCPSMQQEEFLPRLVDKANAFWVKQGHPTLPLPMIPVSDCSLVPEDYTLRVRSCSDTILGTSCEKDGQITVYNDRLLGVDLYLQDDALSVCLIAHELGHWPHNFTHSTKASSIMYDKELLDENGFCNWGSQGL